jgi:orotidine-5'-phosphate decarboxylase
MSSISWVELVQHNTAKYSELVAGIDPSLVDIPAFFEQDDMPFVEHSRAIC